MILITYHILLSGVDLDGAGGGVGDGDVEGVRVGAQLLYKAVLKVGRNCGHAQKQ